MRDVFLDKSPDLGVCVFFQSLEIKWSKLGDDATLVRFGYADITITRYSDRSDFNTDSFVFGVYLFDAPVCTTLGIKGVKVASEFFVGYQVALGFPEALAPLFYIEEFELRVSTTQLDCSRLIHELTSFTA